MEDPYKTNVQLDPFRIPEVVLHVTLLHQSIHPKSC